MSAARGWIAAALLAPTAARAQLSTPIVRELTTIPGIAADEAVAMPNGRVILYTVRDSILAWDIKSRHATLVTVGFDGELTIARAGDQIAYASSAGSLDAIEVLSIDPSSGAARGAARRITALTGDYPSFSPDGKQLAFAADRDAIHIGDLVVAPLSGGPPRLLSHFDKAIWNLSWSADAKWIFLKLGARRDTAGAAMRVAVADGQGEKWLDIPANRVAELWSGEVAFYRSDAEAQRDGRLAFRTTSGARGELSIPANAEPVGGDWSAHALLKRSSTANTTALVDLATGSVRNLPPTTRLTYSGAVWSPDGSRMALADSSSGRYEIALASGTGTLARGQPVSLNPRRAAMEWSPDGSLLAYYSGAGTPAISVLDPATQAVKTLFASAEATFFELAWRPDGRSLMVMKWIEGSQRTRWEVYQVELNGTSRKVRDIPEGKYCCVTFLGSDLMLAGADGNISNEYDLLSSTGSDVLTLSGGNGRRAFAGISPDGKRLVFQLRFQGDRRVTALEVIGSNGQGSRIIRLPFLGISKFEDVVFHPDGQGVLLVGQTPGESARKVFLVPLDGSAVRTLATLRLDARSGRVGIAPNGKMLITTTESAPTTTIYEIARESLRKVVRK